MPRRSIWGTSPRESITAECARRGKAAVLAGCIGLVQGETGDPDLLRGTGTAITVRGERLLLLPDVMGSNNGSWRAVVAVGLSQPGPRR